MPHSPTDLRDIHAVFGSAEVLVDRRRATYSAVIELVTGRPAAATPVDLLDSPTARAHLGEIITAGRSRYRPELMTPLSQLTVGGSTFASGQWQTAVVSDPATRAPLEGAVRTIAAELGDDDGGAAIRLLLDDDPSFDQASQTVLDGLELVSTLCPQLAADLLPHVTLFAITVRDDRSGGLGSASVRQYPGLIVVPQPESPVEVAEALVHEGAHQKFFDLGMTRSIFNADFCRAPFFTASWSAAASTRWPLEQCLAAFHAYSCLATFQESLQSCDPAMPLPDFSLLTMAEQRADELGAWVRDNGAFLGSDGRHLVGLLVGEGVAPASEPPPEAEPPDLPGAVVRVCGPWALIARMEDHIDLYWVPSDELTQGPSAVRAEVNGAIT
jgi:hypothetical protein